MASRETVEKLAKGRTFDLQRSHSSLRKTCYVSPKFIVFDVVPKIDTEWDESGKEVQPEDQHSTAIRATLLPDDEEKIKAMFDLFEIRKSMGTDNCRSLVSFLEQGIFELDNKFYHAVKYYNPFQDYHDWLINDRPDVPIDMLELYRLARGCLEAFQFLELNDFVLTQFNPFNIYATSLSEDRAHFAKVMFKGYRRITAEEEITLPPRNPFSPPEETTNRLYYSYSFSLGLILIWAILQTNGEEFPDNIYSNLSEIPKLITQAITLFSKKLEEDKQVVLKEPFQVFLEGLLEVNISKRSSASDLLTFKWILESDKLDYEAYKKDVEEYEKFMKEQKKEKIYD